jgi:uncharacterized membrane protein YkgB
MPIASISRMVAAKPYMSFFFMLRSVYQLKGASWERAGAGACAPK